jgi:hypothetical protein
MITHRKQIKTNYKVKFSINPMLKDEIKIKKSIKKEHKKVTRVNLSNLRLGS